MHVKAKEFSFLFAWITIILFGTLLPGNDPVQEKLLYLFVAVVCESWIVFHLPGSEFLWIFPENAHSLKYRETRIVSFLLLWFFMLSVPRGFDLFAYCLFALCIERVIFFCSLSERKKISLLQKFFPPFKKHGALSFFVLIMGVFFAAILLRQIGVVLVKCFV